MPNEGGPQKVTIKEEIMDEGVDPLAMDESEPSINIKIEREELSDMNYSHDEESYEASDVQNIKNEVFEPLVTIKEEPKEKADLPNRGSLTLTEQIIFDSIKKSIVANSPNSESISDQEVWKHVVKKGDQEVWKSVMTKDKQSVIKTQNPKESAESKFPKEPEVQKPKVSGLKKYKPAALEDQPVRKKAKRKRGQSGGFLSTTAKQIVFDSMKKSLLANSEYINDEEVWKLVLKDTSEHVFKGPPKSQRNNTPASQPSTSNVSEEIVKTTTIKKEPMEIKTESF